MALATFSLTFSQSLQEIGKTKAEYEQLLKKDLSNSQSTVLKDQNPSNINPTRSEVFLYEPSKKEETGTFYYGYDFFTKRDTIAFWENLPTPSNYLLGPGDELVISLWGATQLRQNYTISREGTIYDEKVGLLNFSGRTMDNASKYLNTQYGKVYATLKGNSPTTFIDVSLGKLRSINVSFVGEVKFPGVYPIHPFSTIITGLIQAGGVDTTGSLRSIKIKRDGKLINEIDLYDYFFYGNIPKNIQLRDQDVIVVPIRNNIITIDSAVYRPGAYEFIPEESVYNIIQYAGGAKPNASKILSLERRRFDKKGDFSSSK